MASNGKPVVTYKYDANGRPVLKTYGNGIRATLSYDGAGRLAEISFVGGPIEVPLNLTYQWDSADQVVARTWNGEALRYQYDAAGRLAKVVQVKSDNTTQDIEAYEYDKAGNITRKTLQGQVTTLTYNAANELISTSSGGGTTTYNYDKAGRLISYTEGPTNTYGWLDKVVKANEPNGSSVAMTYWPDGQLASEGPVGGTAPLGMSKAAYVPGQQPDGEHFLWDGLALLRRDNTLYIAEPHPSGGAIVASRLIGNPAEDTYYLNDLLGTTLAVVQGDQITFNHLTSFGQMRAPAQAATQPAPKPAGIQAPTLAAPTLPLPGSVPTIH